MKIAVSIGAYIVLRGDDIENDFLKSSSGNIIAQILSFNKDLNIINCRVLVLLSSVIPLLTYDVDEDGNIIELIREGEASGIYEVVSSCYQVLASPVDIIDLSFIFNLLDFESGRAYGQGINNCFLLRYKHNNQTNLLTTLKDQITFPSNSIGHYYFDSCSSSVIWYRISSLQDAIWRALNCRADRQDNCVRIPFYFDDVLRAYLLYRTRGIVNPVKMSSGFIRSLTLKGLQRATYKIPNKRMLLRFQDDNQLRCLRSIIGNSATIGQRLRRPKLFEKTILQPLTRLNVIIGRALQLPVRLRRGDRSSRIDFIISDYDSKIVVYYDDYLLSKEADELVNRQNQNIIDNEFIQFMIESNLEEEE
jgi:hypothetical protein